jgi:hypothetical protein
MFARTFGIVIVGLVLCGLSHDAPGQGKDKDKKDGVKDAQKDKKFEVPKDAIVGTVKSVDLKANTFTITTAQKKDRTFTVDEKTEFWGPRGGDRGTGPKGLKDDCMEKGYEIQVVPAPKDSKVAKDVYLPARKTEEKDKK